MHTSLRSDHATSLEENETTNDNPLSTQDGVLLSAQLRTEGTAQDGHQSHDAHLKSPMKKVIGHELHGAHLKPPMKKVIGYELHDAHLKPPMKVMPFYSWKYNARPSYTSAS